MTFGYDSPLWVVTSFFNPSKYRKRLENFRIFRRFLDAPLLVVELERDGAFELDKSDADIVIQLTGEDRIWQKERLLNIGFESLPDHVKYVAWVDCDVIFERDDWVALAIKEFENGANLMQPFQVVSHLRSNWAPRAGNKHAQLLDNGYFDEESFCSCLSAEPFTHDRFQTKRIQVVECPASQKVTVRSIAPGLAWAARRDVLSCCGIYDANIIGGGDRPFAYAAMAMPDEIDKMNWLTEAHLQHFAHWSSDFSRMAAGKLSFVPQKIYHLWHGELANRAYFKRHQIPVSYDFDPERDIQKSANGTWEWAEPRGALARDVAAYFDTRREDG